MKKSIFKFKHVVDDKRRVEGELTVKLNYATNTTTGQTGGVVSASVYNRVISTIDGVIFYKEDTTKKGEDLLNIIKAAKQSMINEMNPISKTPILSFTEQMQELGFK